MIPVPGHVLDVAVQAHAGIEKHTAMDVQVPSGKRVRRKRFTAVQASRRPVAFETPTTPACPNSPSAAYLS